MKKKLKSLTGDPPYYTLLKKCEEQTKQIASLKDEKLKNIHSAVNSKNELEILKKKYAGDIVKCVESDLVKNLEDQINNNLRPRKNIEHTKNYILYIDALRLWKLIIQLENVQLISSEMELLRLHFAKVTGYTPIFIDLLEITKSYWELVPCVN